MTKAPAKEAPLAKQPEAIVISQYEVLLADIDQAVADSADVSFDYNDPAGNKAARSYVAKQRKLRGRIEYARKEAKAWALEYGRAVDGQAKELEAKVLALITPHQQAIEKIEQAEARRVAKHKEQLDLIIDLGRLPHSSTEEELRSALAAVVGIDPSVFEEFSGEAEAAQVRTIEKIELALADKADQAAKDAELEQLRAEKAQRDAELEQLRAAAAADAAAAAAPMPESPHQAAIARPAAAPAARTIDRASAQQQLTPTADDHALELKRQLGRELMENMKGLLPVEVARQLVLGTLHRCLTVNWEVL
jgi:hypothetical protein